MANVVKRDIDWIVDDVTGKILGYQTDRGFIPFVDTTPTLAGVQDTRVLRSYTQDLSSAIFVTNAGTPATVVQEANSPWGGPAAKLTIPDGNTNCEIGLTGLNLNNFDGHIAFEIYHEDYTKCSQMITIMGTVGYAKLLQCTHHLNSSDTGRFSGFHTVVCGPVAVIQSTNTLDIGIDTIDAAKIRFFRVAGQAISVWIRRIFIVPKGRPTFVVTHDDCSSSWIDAALPALAYFKIKADFSIETGRIDTGNLFLTTSQLQRIYDEGHEISSHNVANTPYVSGDPVPYATAYKTALGTLTALFGTAIDGSYHPWVQGSTALDVQRLLRGVGVRIARGTQVGYNYVQAGVGGHIMQMRCQPSHTLSGLATSEEVAKANIDTVISNALKYGFTVIFMVHEITRNPVAVGTETRLFAYEYILKRISEEARSGSVKVCVMRELFNDITAAGLAPTSIA